MNFGSGATLPALIAGLLVGGAALTLIVNELGRHANISVFSRLMLSVGFGLGVLSIGIKAAIILALSQMGEQAFANVTPAAKIEHKRQPEPAIRVPVEIVGSRPVAFRTWRALPEAPPSPRDNGSTAEKIALGRLLFNDKNLSLDRSLSCASCHSLADGGDDNARYSTGYNGQIGNRNAPTVLNAAFLSRLFWDGRAPSLERQAEGPFINPVEMAMPSLAEVEARVRQDTRYPDLFAKAFPDDAAITIRSITRAIAAYERTLVTPDAPYDRYILGDDTALSPQALRGMGLFDEVGCRSCHVDPVFSAAGTEKPLGVYRSFPVFPRDNPFLQKYDLLIEDQPALFRVPSLRNVALTAPYFHNGSVADLEEAIRVMAVSQLGLTLVETRPADLQVLSRRVEDDTPGRNLALIRQRTLGTGEIADIAEFLRALSAPSLPK